MQWEMILWGLETGIKRYDFGGVFELNKEDGLYKFKEGFCREEGVTELIGEIDKIYKPVIYNLFTEVYPRLQRLKIKLLRNG
jgi:lipid II:glycine glycyltransferase (peptidoglycan interpeptide bridge formation enzyme)